MTYNRFVENNLNAWKKVDKDENKLLAIIDKYKLHIAKIIIKDGRATLIKLYNRSLRNAYLVDTLTFLNDLAKRHPSIDLYLYINIKDTLHYENICYYHIDGTAIDNCVLNDFNYGISQSDNNIIRIIKSEPLDGYNESYPVFCFETHRTSNGIMMPMVGMDGESKDTCPSIIDKSFSDKNNDIPIFRTTGVTCDLSNIDKIQLVTSNNQYDLAFASNKCHTKWGNQLLGNEYLELFKNLKLIPTDRDLLPLFNINNFKTHRQIYDHKYIITCGSARNNKWYSSNSCIIEHYFKNKKYFNEDILLHGTDIMYFNVECYDIVQIIDKLKDDVVGVEQMITNRKQKYNDFLTYDSLVNWYGEFLLLYQKEIFCK